MCCACEVSKPIDEFYFNKIYRCPAYRCKKCDNRARVDRDKNNRYAARARWAKWRERHPETAKAWSRAQYRKNPSRYLANVRARQAGLSTATPSWSEREKIKIIYAKAKQYGWQVDHVVPLKHPLVCGLHVWANLQLLDPTLNMSKNNKRWPDMPEAA